MFSVHSVAILYRNLVFDFAVLLAAHPTRSLFGKIYKRSTPKLQKKNSASKSSSTGPNAKTAAILGSYAERSRPIRSEQTFGIGFALVSHR